MATAAAAYTQRRHLRDPELKLELSYNLVAKVAILWPAAGSASTLTASTLTDSWTAPSLEGVTRQLPCCEAMPGSPVGRDGLQQGLDVAGPHNAHSAAVQLGGESEPCTIWH